MAAQNWFWKCDIKPKRQGQNNKIIQVLYHFYMRNEKFSREIQFDIQ